MARSRTSGEYLLRLAITTTSQVIMPPASTERFNTPKCFVRGFSVEGSMRAPVVVESFPLLQLLVQIDVIGVCEQLVKLFFVGAVRSLDFSVELW